MPCGEGISRLDNELTNDQHAAKLPRIQNVVVKVSQGDSCVMETVGYDENRVRVEVRVATTHLIHFSSCNALTKDRENSPGGNFNYSSWIIILRRVDRPLVQGVCCCHERGVLDFEFRIARDRSNRPPESDND